MGSQAQAQEQPGALNSNKEFRAIAILLADN